MAAIARRHLSLNLSLSLTGTAPHQKSHSEDCYFKINTAGRAFCPDFSGNAGCEAGVGCIIVLFESQLQAGVASPSIPIHRADRGTPTRLQNASTLARWAQ